MQYTQQRLALRFAMGADDGSASNMAIVRGTDATHLVGYGWAIYATRTDDGEILVYEDGWREWARERGGQAVHSQFAKIREGISHYTAVPDVRPAIASPPASVSRVGSTPTR